MDESSLSNLILIPTAVERETIESRLQLDGSGWTIQTIGFGVIAAGIETARVLDRFSPSQVILAGIAGLFSQHRSGRFKLGDASWFDSVAVEGIGIGQGDAHIDAGDLGWNWTRQLSAGGDLKCQLPAGEQPARLLTVCAGSACGRDAERRSRRFPDAVGEDMEAFAVAYACRSAGVPLSVVRGFSNLVGQRERSQWRVTDALRSVTGELERMMDERPG